METKCSRRWRGYTPPAFGRACGCECCEYGQAAGRWGLHAVLEDLPRSSRRELAAVVNGLDARLLAATYGSEPDGPGWWERRL